ncbi:hypothetical protein [Pseudotabrizicola sp. 4114]|uniref:hypothetical protein n=1 Tax=Pseudotabrizicola sp. 4114 TaxID=2817731 RepID=UPI0028629DAA|nr:hypothetical protein [Pseudorhodobacter sp. 4114]
MAVLLCSTTLAAPRAAQAGPVLAFVQGIASFISTGAVVGAGIGGAFALGSQVAAILGGTILGRLAVSLALQAIAMRINRPKLPRPPERMTNFAQGRSFMERCYGVVRKGGPVGLTGKVNRVRYYAVLLAAHEIDGVVQHYLDTRQAEVQTGELTELADVVAVFSANIALTGEADLPSGTDGEMTSNSRVIVTGQTNPVENGVWITSEDAWTRPADFNAGTVYERVFLKRPGSFLLFGNITLTADLRGVVIGTHPQFWAAGAPLQSGEIATEPMRGAGRIRVYRGAAGQGADPRLIAAFPGEVTAAYDFAGLAYAAIEANDVDAERFQEVYTQGRHWVYAPVIRGHNRVYDPRDGSFGWTDNAALIFAHECQLFGKAVDWAEVAAEADVCDQIVTNAQGGTQKRWTVNVIFDDGMSWETVRETIATACDGWTYQRPEGGVGLLVGRYIEPTITLTDRDFLSLGVDDGDRGPDEAGEFVISYVEPSRDYSEAPSGAYVVAAGKPRNEIECFAIDSHNQAVRVAKSVARVVYANFTLRGVIKMIGYECIGKRFLRIAHAGIGLDVVIEVDRLERRPDGISFDFEGHSVTAADYAFNAATEEPACPVNLPVSSDDSVQPASGLVGLSVPATGGVAQIQWTWPPQPPSLNQQLRMRSVEAGAEEWQTVTMSSGQTALTVGGLVDGATYDGQIRNRTVGGRVSDWSDTVSITAVANSVPPQDIIGFGLTDVGGGDVLVAFQTADDPNYSAARIWRGTSASFAGATLVHTKFGAPGLIDSWTDTGLPPDDHWYWLAPINGSGVAGTVIGPLTITLS